MWFCTYLVQNFISDVSANIVAEIVITILTIVVVFSRKYIFEFFKNLNLIMSIYKSGMKRFYYNREMLIKQLGPVGQEISKAKKEFIYIGYAMSGVIKQNFSDAVIKAISEKDVKFKICIFDISSDIINSYVAYTGESKETIVQSLIDTEKQINKLKLRIPPDKQDSIVLIKHKHFLPSSCFIVDRDSNDGFIHFNYKPPKSVKYNDFGFIIKNNKQKNNFFKDLLKGYLELLSEIESESNGST